MRYRNASLTLFYLNNFCILLTYCQSVNGAALAVIEDDDADDDVDDVGIAEDCLTGVNVVVVVVQKLLDKIYDDFTQHGEHMRLGSRDGMFRDFDNIC